MCRLHATIHGSGPPVLLLHGFSGAGDDWAGQIDALVAAGRAVIAVDLLGHGRSPAPAEPAAYTMERCVADLLALMDAIALPAPPAPPGAPPGAQPAPGPAQGAGHPWAQADEVIHGVGAGSRGPHPLSPSPATQERGDAQEGGAAHDHAQGGPGAAMSYRLKRFAPATLSAIGYRLSFDLVGYSMGGRVALSLAAAAPQRVRRLVLESASPGLADPAERAARSAADEALAARIVRDGVAAFVAEWERLPLFASQSQLPPEALARQRAQRLRQRPHGLANSLIGMGTGRQPSLWAALPDLAIPTLVITGELDDKFCRTGAQMAARLPDARHITVAGAGHNIHLERPQAFNHLIVEWIQG